MSLSRELARKRIRRTGLPRWWDRLVAIAAVVNLLLVLFDLSYIPLRDFWLQGKIRLGAFKIGPLESAGYEIDVLPEAATRLITQYDVIKGIVPYRDTAQYLAQVDRLKRELVASPLDAPPVEAILADLRRRSVEIIDTNPFELADKTGTLEQIKNRMRERISNPEDSAKQAFQEFWSSEYLRDRPAQALPFFDEEIRPLIERNYYRPVGENGEFVNYFGLIDFPFFALFALDFLARTWNISRRRAGVSWLDAMLWRWWDIFLLIPLWRWLRVIPVVIRLNEADLGVDLRPLKKQASQGLVAGIAEDVTEVVIVRVINQIQDSIRQGEIAKLLAQRQTKYIDINQTDEPSELAKLVAHLAVHKVLPTIKPDVEALLHYNITKAFHQFPLYQRLRRFPGVEPLETGLTEQLVHQIYQTAYGILDGALQKDPVADRLWGRLVEHFSQAIRTELQTEQSLTRIEDLLTDLLEEVKINYVQRLSQEDVEEILEQTRALRQLSTRVRSVKGKGRSPLS